MTIEDPLVSRQHGRIIIDDEKAVIEDLGSRNGVKLNGVTVRGSVSLNDGDRLRIGTQDLVFCRVDPVGAAHAKTTGVLRLCANCRLPYPREMVACPNCEATEQTEEETLSGSFGTEKRHAWNVQLLVEALEKALTLGRWSDADRIVRRATAQVEELIVSGTAVDKDQLAQIAVAAAKAAIAGNDVTWGVWVTAVYRRVDKVPPPAVLDSLVALTEKFGRDIAPHIAQLAEHLRAAARPALDTKDGPAEADGLVRLEQLRRLVTTVGAANETTDPESTRTLS